MALDYAVLVKPRNVRTPEASAIVGDGALFGRMVKAGWIRPVVDRPKCKLYRVADVQRCCDWLDQGYYPGEKDSRNPKV